MDFLIVHVPPVLMHHTVSNAFEGKVNLKAIIIFYSPANAQAIVLKTILKFTFKLHSDYRKKGAVYRKF